jgi:hypothetical protein
MRVTLTLQQHVTSAAARLGRAGLCKGTRHRQAARVSWEIHPELCRLLHLLRVAHPRLLVLVLLLLPFLLLLLLRGECIKRRPAPIKKLLHEVCKV